MVQGLAHILNRRRSRSQGRVRCWQDSGIIPVLAPEAHSDLVDYLLCVRRDRHNAVTQTPEPRATLFLCHVSYPPTCGWWGGGVREFKIHAQHSHFKIISKIAQLSGHRL